MSDHAHQDDATDNTTTTSSSLGGQQSHRRTRRDSTTQLQDHISRYPQHVATQDEDSSATADDGDGDGGGDEFHQQLEQLEHLSQLPVARLARRSTQARIDMPVSSSAYLCGLLAGVAQAGVFNPYDRALYLSVTYDRSFLSWQNWKAPYTGFFQSIGGRALAGGLYFPLEHYFLHLIRPHGNGGGTMTSASYSTEHFIAGTSAGAANAIVLNPLSAIKYRTWRREVSRGMWAEASRMLHKAGGLRPFWNGLLPTLYRDVTFGGVYTFLRFRIQACGQLDQWQANCLAAALATIASGPFNYVRNIQYGTKSREKALSTWMILKDLWWQTAEQDSLQRRIQFLTTKLRIGWGTIRVSLGMSLGHTIYDLLHDHLVNARLIRQ